MVGVPKRIVSFYIHCVATLLWESVKMRLTFLKWGLGNPPRLQKFQSSIVGVKTFRIEAFFISLKSYRRVDVKNGLTWAIWTFVAHVMAKRKVGNQIGNLIPDHRKSRIDPISMHADGVRYVVGKLFTRPTTLL